MSNVKRYELHFAADSMLKVDDAGRFVLASDYDAMAQRCRELEADLAEQAARLEEASKQRDFLDKQQSDECVRREKAEAGHDILRAEIERLRALLAECAGYLNTNELTSIGHGSILHRKMIDAAMEVRQ